MTESHSPHLPVLEEAKVVGMIPIANTVKWIISDQEHAIQVLEGYIVGAFKDEPATIWRAWHPPGFPTC